MHGIQRKPTLVFLKMMKTNPLLKCVSILNPEQKIAAVALVELAHHYFEIDSKGNRKIGKSPTSQAALSCIYLQQLQASWITTFLDLWNRL